MVGKEELHSEHTWKSCLASQCACFMCRVKLDLSLNALLHNAQRFEVLSAGFFFADSCCVYDGTSEEMFGLSPHKSAKSRLGLDAFLNDVLIP